MDSSDRNNQIFIVWLLFIATLSVGWVLAVLFIRGDIPLYPGAPIAYLLLLAFNGVVLWRTMLHRVDSSTKGGLPPSPMNAREERTFGGPEKRFLIIWVLVILDIPALLGFGLLILHGDISLYRDAPSACVALLILNGLLVWRICTLRSDAPERGAVPLSLKFNVAAFTLASIIAIIAFVKTPSVQWGVQVGVGILLSGYNWYLLRVIRGRRIQENKLPQ